MKKMVLGIVLLMISTISVAEKAVLLVSLGMPDNALIAYLKQGKQYHIPVVIRGLYTKNQRGVKSQSNNNPIGSFKDTATRVKTLVQKSEVGGVSINPLIFRAFNIKVVPALIVYDDDLSCIKKSSQTTSSHCKNDRFDVIFGNLPINKLLTIISQRSRSPGRSNFSKSLLRQFLKEGEVT